MFPKNLKKIEFGVFSNCALTSIVLHEGLETIGTYAFCDTPLKSAVIPRSVISISDDAFQKHIYNKRTDEIEYIENENLTMYCYPGSYGLVFAREHGYQVRNADI